MSEFLFSSIPLLIGEYRTNPPFSLLIGWLKCRPTLSLHEALNVSGLGNLGLLDKHLYEKIEARAMYRVSKKTWTFFEFAIIPLIIKESFQNFVWL